MASNEPAAPSGPLAAQKPLAMMTKLSPYVSFFEPDPSTTVKATDDKNAPKLILFASWMDARDVHIAKYLAHYRATYPSTPILLIKLNSELLLYPSRQWTAAGPAVTWLKSKVEKGDLTPSSLAEIGNGGNGDKPQMLAHVFSNGGITSLQNVARRFHGESEKGDYLPSHAAVFDSCPGVWDRFWSGYEAVMMPFKRGNPLVRLLVSPIVMTLFSGLWVWWKSPLRHLLARGRQDLFDRNFGMLNRGVSGVLGAKAEGKKVDPFENDVACGIALQPRLGEGPGQTRRTYIYSEEDDMIDWHHVERNAREAVKMLVAEGASDADSMRVRLEKFDGTAHVSHMRADPTKYWGIVRETWEGTKF